MPLDRSALGGQGWARTLGQSLPTLFTIALLGLSGRPVQAQDAGGRNHLEVEKSPYLRQHAGNPVWWWSWSPEALAQARRQNRPIFLSIGYSTCHFCHVMEKESFEKEDVARVLNDSFIAIKVDREERPDLDAHYMRAVELMTGNGGWPMTTVLLPDGKPFFGATYLRHDQLIETLQLIAARWQTAARSRMDSYGAELAKEIARVDPAAGGPLTGQVLLDFAAQQAQRFDPQYGGSQGAPKFPPAYALRTLLRIQRRRPEPARLAQIVKTLDAMARGGIYDHLGGGFHRYCIDDRWRIPHFEKMLYDQAALANAYLDGYAATGNPEYAAVVRETLDYVLRELTSPEGAFYSAEDADSEGEEGKYYVWTLAELKSLLAPAELDAVSAAFGITESGNFSGRNILQLGPGDRTHRTPLLTATMQRLRLLRSRRVHPLRDDKVITSWNGLMITAMARAARTLAEPRYAKAAQRAAEFLLAHARTPDGSLLRRFCAGQARYPAYLTDYANLIDGLIELYQTDFAAGWLREAVQLQARQERSFAAPAGGYFLTDGRDPSLPDRSVTFEDDVRPAGTSVSALNLLRLAELLEDDSYRQRATRLLAAAPPAVQKYPSAFPVLLAALDYQLDASKQVAIIGDPGAPATRALLAAVRRGFHPNQVVVAAPPGAQAPPVLRDKIQQHGRPTAYVCEHQTCQAPTADPAVVSQQLQSSRPLP